MENWYEKTREKTEHVFQAISKHDFVIDTYASNEFAAVVQQAIDIANDYALTASSGNLAKMEESFIKTSQLEWMFWDSAYKQEAWKI